MPLNTVVRIIMVAFSVYRSFRYVIYI